MSSQPKQFIYLVDDDDSVRSSLKAAFEAVGYEVHPFSSAMDFLAQEDYYWPAVVINDVRMPKMSGVEMQTQLLERGLNIPIIFISGQSTAKEVITGLKQGAIDFLLKPLNMQELMAVTLKAFEKVHQDHIETHRRLTKQQKLEKLAPREREACELIAKGYSNLEIGEKLNIKADTAKQYKIQIFEKLGLDGVPALIEFMGS